MLSVGPCSYIRYGISYAVLFTVLALRPMFASVDSDLPGRRVLTKKLPQT